MATASTRPKALITGASAGIGEGFARHLAQRGHDVVLVARRLDRLSKLAGELSAAHSIIADVMEADLAREEGVSRVEERVRSEPFDLVVNNAGFGSFGPFAERPLARELEMLDVNVRALLRLSHAALSSMVPRGKGGIINVASTAAFQPIPYNATYAATKAFVLHFSEALHEEAKEHGVTVTCLCPGPVRTEFQQVAGLDEHTVPAMAWTSVATVVDSALLAVRGGRAIAVPGAFNRMGAMSTRLVPRFVTRRITASMFKNRGRTAS